jgi:hypothetical protein
LTPSRVSGRRQEAEVLTLDHAAELPPIIARHYARAHVTPFALAGGALTLVVTTHLVDLGVYDLTIRPLDASYEWSWSHVAATGALAAGAMIGAAGWRLAARRRRAWLAGSAIFGLLCVDNVTRFHTHITGWPLIYAPLLGTLFLAVAAVAWDTERAPAVAAGLGLLATSLAIHVFGHELVRALDWGPRSWPYEVKVALKEGTELAGWTLLVPALATLALRARIARGPAA